MFNRVGDGQVTTRYANADIEMFKYNWKYQQLPSLRLILLLHASSVGT